MLLGLKYILASVLLPAALAAMVLRPELAVEIASIALFIALVYLSIRVMPGVAHR